LKAEFSKNGLARIGLVKKGWFSENWFVRVGLVKVALLSYSYY